MTDELKVETCRRLLAIRSRGTMNSYLKSLSLFGKKLLTWDDLRSILELQVYLGLKHGFNSKQRFHTISKEELAEMFKSYGVDLNKRLKLIQVSYYKG